MKAVLFTTLLGASCATPNGLQEVLPEYQQVIYEEWTLTQSALKCLGYEGVERVTPDMFHWRVYSSTFTCGGVEATGCFETSEPLISFWKGAPKVIRHEAGHAILWKLRQRPFYKCFQHPDLGWCPEALKYPWEGCP